MGTTSSFMRFRWIGERDESFTALKMELQNWVGALHGHMLRVMEFAEQ